MRFAHIQMLYALWLVLPLGFFFIWGYKHRRKILSRFAQTSLLRELSDNHNDSKERGKYILLLLTFILCISALARPQWGFEWMEIKRQGVDILLVVDTSKSMLTRDVKPNRLERTKLAVQDLLKKLEGDRIGLMAFAGEAFMTCPLTSDYDGFLLSLNDLNADTIPQGGTNIAKAIDEAMKGYTDTAFKNKAIILITDGEEIEGDALTAAKKAKDAGVKIYTVGVGTKEGELIQINNEQGESEFLKDKDGNFVKSRLNEPLLREIALSTEGVYVKASGAQFGLDLIYEHDLSKMEKRELESKKEKKYHERFQFPLSLAVLLLVMETCLSTRKKNK